MAEGAWADPSAAIGSGDSGPVTFGQQWWLRRMVYDLHISDRAIAEANVDVVWPLPVGVSVAAVQRAWERLVERNETLRTVFDWDRACPIQTVEAPRVGEIEVIDLPDESPDRAREVAMDLARHTFLLEKQHPWLAVIISSRNEPKFLALAFHHVAVDHTSMSLLSQQFRALLQGRSVPPQLRAIDIAVEQRAAIDQNRETHEYWTQQWGDLAEDDRVGNDHTGRVEGSVFSRRMADAARHVGDSLGVSVHAVILGVSAIVLTRLKRRDRVTLALMSSNRIDGYYESLVSPMTQIAPLTITVDETAPVDDLLLDTFFRSLEAYGHGSYDIDKLRDHLADAGFANPDPMAFDCYFNLVYGLPSVPDAGSPLATSIEWQKPRRRTGPRFMLAVAVDEPGVIVELRASNSYLTPGQVAEFLGSFESALVNIAERAPRTIADIDMTPMRPIPTESVL